MPKLKSHSGASKRFKKMSGGRIKRRGANRNHILTKHTTKRKRSQRVQATSLKPCDARLAKRMIHGS